MFNLLNIYQQKYQLADDFFCPFVCLPFIYVFEGRLNLYEEAVCPWKATSTETFGDVLYTLANYYIF